MCLSWSGDHVGEQTFDLISLEFADVLCLSLLCPRGKAPEWPGSPQTGAEEPLGGVKLAF